MTRNTRNRLFADTKEGSRFRGSFRFFFSRLCAIVKSVRWYFGTPLPLRGGFPPRIHSHPAVHTQRMGVFLPVLRTSFSVRLYAAFMQAYEAYRRPQNIEFYSIWQKNTHLFAYVQNLLYLCSRFGKICIPKNHFQVTYIIFYAIRFTKTRAYDARRSA